MGKLHVHEHVADLVEKVVKLRQGYFPLQIVFVIFAIFLATIVIAAAITTTGWRCLRHRERL